jgi:predicted glycoside hydrolase/deacetylase ChbG (UPF0249 family)
LDLWITADDYGLSAGTNSSIEALAEAGAISAASVMAHADADFGAIDRLRRSGVVIGLHLSFTQARPLVRELGQWGGGLPRGYKQLFAELAVRPGLLGLIADEADAQVDRLASAGVTIDFINGHEHVHLFPPLWPIALRAARRARARAVRIALGQPIDWTQAGLLAASSRACWALTPAPDLAIMSPLGVGRAGSLTLDGIGRLLDRPFSARALRTQQPIARELCVHPAIDVSGRREEHAWLASGALASLLARRSIRVLRHL